MASVYVYFGFAWSFISQKAAHTNTHITTATNTTSSSTTRYTAHSHAQDGEKEETAPTQNKTDEHDELEARKSRRQEEANRNHEKDESQEINCIKFSKNNCEQKRGERQRR